MNEKHPIVNPPRPGITAGQVVLIVVIVAACAVGGALLAAFRWFIW